MNIRILDILYANKDYVSGETICKQLNVSRTSIWKNINSLKKEGYNISSINNKGYKLIQEDFPLNEYEVKRHYNGEIDLEYIPSIDSTNNYAKEVASKKKKDISLIFTKNQINGRGRLGRSFISNNDKGIWASYIFKPSIEPSKSTIFTLAASVAVCKTLNKVCKVKTMIKWPNDIILNNRKVCGILTEMNCEMDIVNYIITGIGINLLQESFDKDLKNIATSIYIETKKKYDRGLIIATLCYNINNIYELIKKNNYKQVLEEWNCLSLINGKEIKIIKNKEVIYGQAIGIDEEGKLIVLDKNGIERIYNSGEVSIRGIMGCTKKE